MEEEERKDWGETKERRGKGQEGTKKRRKMCEREVERGRR